MTLNMVWEAACDHTRCGGSYNLVGKLSAVTVGASNAAKTAVPLKRKGVKTTPLGKVG
jgi:hypothetical protein